MPPVLRASALNEILPPILSRVAAATGLDPSRVALYAGDPEDCPHFGGEQDVLFCVGEESSGGLEDGCGRYCDLRRQSLEVAVRTRLFLDAPNSDYRSLTSATRGHLALRDVVYDCLQLWLVEVASTQPGARQGDMDGVSMPSVTGSWSRPRKSRASKQSEGWAVSSLTLTVPYQRTLTLPEVS